MPFTPTQLAALGPTLAADIAANNAVLGGTGPFAASQIKNIPHTQDAAFDVASWYSAIATPSWFVWNSNISRGEVYRATPAGGVTWDWTIYKAQSPSEQDCWKEIFMGGSADFGRLNNRVGVGKIFVGSAPQTAQRDFIFSVVQRVATRLEKLFATEITGAPANTGNDNVTGNFGKATNPGLLVVIGALLPSEVNNVWAI